MSECLWESLTLVCGTRSTGAAGSGVGGYAEGNEAYNRHSSTPKVSEPGLTRVGVLSSSIEALRCERGFGSWLCTSI